MSEGTSNIVYAIIALLSLMISVWKGMAFRRDPTPTLALTAVNFACSAATFAMASPNGYRAVGDVAGEPSFATLPVYLGIIVCFSSMHILTLLWDRHLRRDARILHRKVAGWTGMYVSGAALMITFFSMAGLKGPADPLRFNTNFADEPPVLLFLAVFLTTLVTGTFNAYRQGRRMRLDDARLQDAVNAFGVAMLFFIGYAVCSAPAIAAAALGSHALDAVGVFGATSGSLGALTVSYGLSGAAMNAWWRERRDLRALQPLWDLVVADVDGQLAFSATSARGGRLANVRFLLHRRVIEILDGIRALRPWVRSEPIDAVYALHQESDCAGGDVEARATAAALRDAVARLRAARDEAALHGETGLKPPTGRSAPLPGEDTAALDERARLVRVAQALSHPAVAAVLDAAPTQWVPDARSTAR